MAGKNTKTFDDATFERAILEGPVLVDFWAEWCQPCRVLGPVIDQIADEFAGKTTVGKVDIDANAALAKRFDVSSIPTVILIVDGKEQKRWVGINRRESYTDAISEVLDAVSSA